MSCPLSETKLQELRAFVELLKTQPSIIHNPTLSFFKDYLISVGAKLPAAEFKPFTHSSGDSKPSEPAAPKEDSSAEEEDEPESDVELDLEGVIEPDTIDPAQLMGDDTKETTDEERDESDTKRSQAMSAFGEQKFDEAIKFYTEAIQLNPQSALLFAKRGQVYLKLNKPNACIKDCTKALELNCDSAAAYKFRGRAYRLLGKFEESLHDLCESLKIDYDDQTNEWLAEVKPNAEKLRQHRLITQRKKDEKEQREKVRRARKAAKARAEASKAQKESGFKPSGAGGFPFGGMPGEGGMPNKILELIMQDPSLIAAFQDPEVEAAFADVSQNPANFIKYQNNPKVMAIISKLQGMGGAPSGAGPGAAPGFPPGPGFTPKPPTNDDFGLD